LHGRRCTERSPLSNEVAERIRAIARERVIVLDGAWGVLLQAT
jgi:methionine synthase I (cobalamin-dependent)